MEKTRVPRSSDPEGGEVGLARFVFDLPNAVTLIGLAVGLAAVVSTIRGRPGPGLFLAMIAVLIDHLDGYLARRQPLRSDSLRNFGAHLDCYADLVSKGIFPALLLLTACDFQLSYWPIAVFGLIAVAIRYSYEFIPNATPRGLSPDYGLPIFALCHLGRTHFPDAYPLTLGAALLVMAGLNLAPIRVPMLRGGPRAIFLAILLILMAALLPEF
jgi:CDP-diacylglycerol--serine O-phosphatidyltransferase